MSLRIVPWLLAGVLGVALAATAHAASPDRQQSFEQTDTDKNGLITREEYRNRMVEVFYAADANGDGVLTPDELVDVDIDRFRAADVNEDGKLQMVEFLNFRARDFERFDTNRDGVLSDDEVP